MKDRKTERQRDRETERQRDRETERQRDRETTRQRDRETERQRGSETERQRDRYRGGKKVYENANKNMCVLFCKGQRIQNQNSFSSFLLQSETETDNYSNIFIKTCNH
jgi:hypothetical protein